MHISLEGLDLPRGQFYQVVEQSLAIIRQQCNRIQSVTQIADLVGVNYHTMRSRFRRETSLTMEGCLIRNRVFLAYTLILESSKQIKEIAWNVGYQNDNQLTRATKKYLGTTPHIMRRHHRLSGMVSQGLLQAKQLY